MVLQKRIELYTKDENNIIKLIEYLELDSSGWSVKNKLKDEINFEVNKIGDIDDLNIHIFKSSNSNKSFYIANTISDNEYPDEIRNKLIDLFYKEILNKKNKEFSLCAKKTNSKVDLKDYMPPSIIPSFEHFITSNGKEDEWLYFICKAHKAFKRKNAMTDNLSSILEEYLIENSFKKEKATHFSLRYESERQVLRYYDQILNSRTPTIVPKNI